MGRNAGDVSLLPTFTAGLAVFRRSGGSTCGVLFHLSLALLAKLVVALSNADHWIPYFLERCRLPQCCRRNWISCSAASGLLRSAGVGWKLLIYGAIPIVFGGTIVCLCKIFFRKQ